MAHVIVSSSETELSSRTVVWKRQFTYVYGRLYETNGERSSIRILRYSLDALAREFIDRDWANGSWPICTVCILYPQ